MVLKQGRDLVHLADKRAAEAARSLRLLLGFLPVLLAVRHRHREIDLMITSGWAAIRAVGECMSARACVAMKRSPAACSW